MRIVFISFEFLPSCMGGIGTYVHHASRMLAEAGHEVTVICYGQESAPGPIDGANVYPVNCADRQGFHSAAAKALRILLSSQAFDVLEVPDLYAEGLSSLLAFPALASVMRLHTPSVVSACVNARTFPWVAVALQVVRVGLSELLHGRLPIIALRMARGRSKPSAFYDPFVDLERQAALRATLLVSPSKSLARKVEKVWCLPAHRIEILPYPLHQYVLHEESNQLLPGFGKSPSQEESFEVLYYGGLKTFKGVDVLVRAMVPLLRSNRRLRLTLAGSSSPSPLASISALDFLRGTICQWQEMLPWLEARVAHLGSAVRILPWQSSEQIQQLLAQADLCVFPSRYDNFPSACLEAMAAGKAIVATRSGGMAEMLCHGESGLLVPPGHHRPLRAAIQRLICNSQLRHRLSQAARHRYESHYRPDRILSQHVALYEKAFAIKHGRLLADHGLLF
jgi:glycosyltransferase involved in cell wall biosynthesis